jgi:hypothetical protein
MLELSPSYLFLEGHILWVFEGGKFLEFHLDPKELHWRKRGSLLESNIFGYTTKRGYKEIISRQGCQLSFDFELQQSGITPRQKKIIFSKFWHPCLPHKVSTMIWLILANGLLLGSWRTKMGQEGLCKVCNAKALERVEHTISSCEALKGMWEKVRLCSIRSDYQDSNLVERPAAINRRPRRLGGKWLGFREEVYHLIRNSI